MGKIRVVHRIVVCKAKSTKSCAEKDCTNVIEKGTPCYARRPGEEYICSACAAKRGWLAISKDRFLDPALKAGEQAAEERKRKRKPKEEKEE